MDDEPNRIKNGKEEKNERPEIHSEGSVLDYFHSLFLTDEVIQAVEDREYDAANVHNPVKTLGIPEDSKDNVAPKNT